MSIVEAVLHRHKLRQERHRPAHRNYRTRRSLAGKRGRVMTGLATAVGAGSDSVAGRRIGRSQITQGLVEAPGCCGEWAFVASAVSKFLRASAKSGLSLRASWNWPMASPMRRCWQRAIPRLLCAMA